VDETIIVDLDQAENNGDFLVIPFSNYTTFRGHLLNGFLIECKHVDMRQIMVPDSKFKAFLLPSLNEVMILTPGMSFPFLSLAAELYEKQKGYEILCEPTRLGREVVKNGILDDNERQVKSIILKFPEGYQLTTEFVSKDSIAYGEIPLEITPIQSVSKIHGKDRPFTDIFLQWKVHQLEDTPRVSVRAEETVVNDAAAQLAERLSGMEM
jgi:hypothetical protein